MNIRKRLILVSSALALLLSACGGASGPGPRTWIDAPLDGSVLELGPVVVRSHAAADGGTARAVLTVNGVEVRVDESGDGASALTEFAQAWTPEGPGEYVLQVISLDQAGNEGRSNRVHVRVGDASAAPTDAATPESGVTQTPVLTPTITQTSDPIITFNTGANCREGDSTAYDVVTAFEAGAQARITGRNADASWFLVAIPGGGDCWASASTGTPSGPYQSVPVVASPPLPPTDTPVPAQPPAQPGNVHIGGEVCTSEEFSVTLEWNDVSGEDGYRVYRDGGLIATLGEGVTQYTDSPPDYNAHEYGVEAFNTAGSSARPSAQEDGCLF